MRTFSQIFRLAVLASGFFALAPFAYAGEDSARAEVAPTAKLFANPEAAGEAVLAATKARDHDALVVIFGTQSDDLLSSGDPVADSTVRDRFIAAYERKHAWVAGPGDARTLTVGELDWPLPVPLVQTKDGWRFDVEQGREEILDRRVGRNELGAIQACLAFVDAEHEYYAEKPLGDPPRFAARIASSEGKKDGLYWPTDEGEPQSPLGPEFAQARAQGYTPGDGARAPFHGYLFKILTKQGEAANGGEQSYERDGAMTEGFALLAWPAKYGNSGVMTFLVDENGVVYEKDLGPETPTLGQSIDAFDPDVSWDVVPAEARMPPEIDGGADERTGTDQG